MNFVFVFSAWRFGALEFLGKEIWRLIPHIYVLYRASVEDDD